MPIRYPKKRGDEEEVKQASRVAPEDARQAAREPEAQPETEPDTDIYGAAKDTSVFGEAAADMGIKAPIPGDIRQAAQDVAADTRAASQDYLEDVYEGDEGDGGAPAPAEEEPQGLFEDVTDIDARQERERAAFADELAARKAEQQQQAEARAGLGGMGLSGATAELTADIGRQAERAGDIAMADLGRRQQQETFDELRRQASIWGFEEEFGIDVDGDDSYGPPDQTETPEQSAKMAEQMSREAKGERQVGQDAMSERIGKDVNTVDVTDNPLDVYSPFNKDMGTYEDDSGFTWRIYERPDGSYFKVMA